MSFAREPLLALVAREVSRLEDALGKGACRVEAVDADAVTVRCALLDARFGRERDGRIGALLVLHDPPAGGCDAAETWTWAKFLEVEPPPVLRDQAGRVTDAPEAQVRRELIMIQRLVAEVFSDPNRLRDAAFFVKGYGCAYNDWARGAWSGDQA